MVVGPVSRRACLLPVVVSPRERCLVSWAGYGVLSLWRASSDAFLHVAGVLRSLAANRCTYSMPLVEHVDAFEQHVPVGSSRVAAGAADVDAHVLRATSMYYLCLVVTCFQLCSTTWLVQYELSPPILILMRLCCRGERYGEYYLVIIWWADKTLRCLARVCGRWRRSMCIGCRLQSMRHWRCLVRRDGVARSTAASNDCCLVLLYDWSSP